MTNTITFTCQTITPMFLHGANGTTPELRPASVKGVLRFWWRALHGHLPLAQLKELEGMIFGSTEQRSTFSIRVLDLRQQPRDTPTENVNPLPHKASAKFTLLAIPVGTTFRLRFTFYNIATINGKKFDIAALQSLFELVSILGALGKRARRGFGSFEITHTQTGQDPTTPFQIDYSLATIQQLYAKVTGKVLHTQSNVLKRPDDEGKADFPYIKKIRLGSVMYPNLLRRIGAATSAVKASNGDSWDYRQAIGYAAGQKRLASPVFVSAISSPKGLLPVITTLNMAWDNGKRSTQRHRDIQEQFQNHIL
ncbi:type III-B CRISPR module RAMP protein Cmr1 [Microscilla marina]|uniref:Crispr-associated ramp protein n=1 Tax=Microscilla marina ATCC 23134 TaxID=313606 RepID=A1ZP56_MICM2|nr:type III-B CRISPR module RAMP protein Cmr1 [Microscilla marina]EAY27848.1 crispr-associated ramp protein [Microscilla marina ATCC 23134]